MNIVIVHSKTKRRISGSFELIGSRGDLLSLGEQITSQCYAGSWVYGSIDILATKQCVLTNQKPIEWD